MLPGEGLGWGMLGIHPCQQTYTGPHVAAFHLPAALMLAGVLVVEWVGAFRGLAAWRHPEIEEWAPSFLLLGVCSQEV